jgi:signal transduction histidine kinase
MIGFGPININSDRSSDMAGDDEQSPMNGISNDFPLEGTYDPYRSFFEGTLQEVVSLEAIFDNQGVLVDLVIREVNPIFVQETGIQAEQAVGKRISEVFGSDEILNPYREAVVETLSSRKTRQLEVYFQPLDKHYQVLLEPIEHNLFAALAYDISTRKKAAEAMLESEARFRLVMANSSITVFTMDCDLRYTWIYNPNAGLPIEEMIGKRDGEIFDPESAAKLVEQKQKVLRTGRGLRIELAFRIQGQPVIKDEILEPIWNEAGHVAGLTGVTFDITEKRSLEARNLEYQAQMEVQQRLIDQREQERVQIARDLHDGPLQDMIGVTYAIKRLMGTLTDRRANQDLNDILDSVQNQVQELRFFASELRPPVLTKFGLVKAIRSHSAVLRGKHPDLRIHLNLVEEVSPLPENLRISLYRIYQESVSNIARHAQASDIWVAFLQESGPAGGGEAVLEIRDNGVGFRLPDHWIDLARQGHLGLVGMRERAEAAGGRLQILSRPGEGTTVRVSIPLMKI